MTEPSSPEVWLRGPIEGVAQELMPVVHSLLQVREELAALSSSCSPEQFWVTPGGAASVGFHVMHLAGSLDRLLTYARGASLSDGQRAALAAEGDRFASGESPAVLFARARAAVDAAVEQARSTPIETLGEARRVGRAGLPSTVGGLLFHAAEHAQRHAGQIATTVRIVRATLPVS